MTRILITGGSGFIGGATVRELERRHHTVIPFDAHNGHDVRDADMLDQIVKLNEVETVVHLAGVLGTHELFDVPQIAVDVNVTGTLNVLEACRRYGCGYVGITMPDVFPSLYTATKIAAQRLAWVYQQQYGLKVVHVRAFNAFGPGQAVGPGHPQKIVPTFATELAHGRPVPVWGSGGQTVDLIYVDDLAKVLADSVDYLDRLPAQMPGDRTIIDAGTGTAFTVLDVVRAVARHLGVDPVVKFLPMRRGEVETHIVATGEGWEHIGDKPEFDPSDLANTVAWYAAGDDPWGAS
jgi:UDP-glucose 4-epimerase